MVALKTIKIKFYFSLIMKKSDRKKLEHSVTEKLIAMIQTNDLDRMSIFFADLSETLTPKQLNVLNSVIADYGFNNFEGIYNV